MTLRNQLRKLFSARNLTRPVVILVVAAGIAGASAAVVECDAKKTPPKPTATSPDIDEAVRHQLKISGGKYTLEQARARALNADIFDYPFRHNITNPKETFSTCVQADYSADQVPPSALHLWQDIQTLKNSKTVMGPALISFATKANIFYCHENAGSDMAGLWDDGDGIIKVSQKENGLLPQAHETIHGIHRTTRVRHKDDSWSLEDFQMSILSYEAAARVGEYLLALELSYQNQQQHFWKEVMDIHAVQAQKVLMAYDTALKKNASHIEALTAAGVAGFHAQFKNNQIWLDFYNNSTLGTYLIWMTKGWLKPPSGKTYSLDIARMTGYISPEFNFTAGLDRLPAYGERFGNNVRMKQAFDYVESERLAYTLGRQDLVYLKMRMTLETEKNPYFGIDLGKVLADLQDPKNAVLKPLDVMEAHARILPYDKKQALNKIHSS